MSKTRNNIKVALSLPSHKMTFLILTLGGPFHMLISTFSYLHNVHKIPMIETSKLLIFILVFHYLKKNSTNEKLFLTSWNDDQIRVQVLVTQTDRHKKKPKGSYLFASILFRACAIITSLSS